MTAEKLNKTASARRNITYGIDNELEGFRQHGNVLEKLLAGDSHLRRRRHVDLGLTIGMVQLPLVFVGRGTVILKTREIHTCHMHS